MGDPGEQAVGRPLVTVSGCPLRVLDGLALGFVLGASEIAIRTTETSFREP
jgi:hypothetical protein